MRFIASGVAMVLVTFSLSLAGCSKQEADGPAISVSDAWARPTIGASTNTAAYMTLTNNRAEADRLLSATAQGAAHTQLHETQMKGDVMSMTPVEGGIEIPAHGSVTFAPQGLHIMVMGLSKPLAEGGTLPLTLTFEKAGTVDLSVPVRRSAP